MMDREKKGFFQNPPDEGEDRQRSAEFGKTKYVCRECGADVAPEDWECSNCGMPDVQEMKVKRSHFFKKEL